MMFDIEIATISLEKNGGVFFPDYFSSEEVEILLNSFSLPLEKSINNNICGSVYYLQQKFISQTLVHSRPVFEMVSGNDFFGVCKRYLGQPVIKASRYYETGAGGISLWHHDEKNNGYAARGLIGIVYLTDVSTTEEGPFEYISGSHELSLNMNDSEFFTSKINDRFGGEVVTCLGRKGSLILADSRVIHRARPHNNKKARKSLFVQVSKFAPTMYKELILVNPSFLNKRHIQDEVFMKYLGFELPCQSVIYPPTDVTHMPVNKEVFGHLAAWLINRFRHSFFETLPKSLKVAIRSKLRRPVDYDAQKR